MLNVRTILPYGQFGVNPAWMRDCLVGVWGGRDQWQSVWKLYSKVRLGCAWLSGAGRCADAESPVRKETARRSRVMIGAWGNCSPDLICLPSAAPYLLSLYPTDQFSGVPFITRRLFLVSRCSSWSPVRVCCTARGIDVLGLRAAGASGKQWSVADLCIQSDWGGIQIVIFGLSNLHLQKCARSQLIRIERAGVGRRV